MIGTKLHQLLAKFILSKHTFILPYAKAQAIKYVYRNVETVEDEATQLNLEQIEDGLVDLGLK